MKESADMLNKTHWDLRSRWKLREQQPTVAKYRLAFLFEHEVTISSANSNVELTARFVHSLPCAWPLPRPFCRGNLVSLVIRNRRNRRTNLKRIDLSAFHRRLPLKFKAINASPQSRAVVSGSSSPVSTPLALSANTGIVPIVPAAEPIKEDIGTSPSLPSPSAVLLEQNCAEINVSTCGAELPPDANAAQTTNWLRARRFHAFESTFSSFSGSDILRLSRDDLIQICGLADGIRLFNALHAKAPQPRLSLYFALESCPGSASLWRAVYLDSLTSSSFTTKLLAALNLPHDRLHSLLLHGPHGIHVLVTNELIANIRDESMFLVEIIKEPGTERYKLLLKPFNH